MSDPKVLEELEKMARLMSGLAHCLERLVKSLKETQAQPKT